MEWIDLAQYTIYVEDKMMGFCESSAENSGSIRGGEFRDHRRNCVEEQ